MKKALSVLLALTLALGMTACKSKEKETYYEVNSEGDIVDSELLEKVEQESTPLNTKVGDYNYHSGNNLIITPYNATVDGKFMYVYSYMGDQGYVKIDLQSGEVIPLCDVAGCTHDYDQFPDCINNREFSWITAVGDELWYSNNNKLFAIKDGKEEVIYENNYCTQLEEDTLKESPDQKYTIYYPIVDDNYVYIFGMSYVLQLDRSTKEVLKTIDLPTEAALRTPFVYKGSIYFCNDMQEAFRTDIESGETIKLGDHVNCVYVKNDTIYYTDWNDGAVTLYKADLDLQNSEKLIDDCYMDFVIKENKIFYSSNSDEKIMCYDLDTGESKTVYDGFDFSGSIITADYIDRVFFIGEAPNPNDETSPYDVIASVRTDGSDLWVKQFEGDRYSN